MTALLAALLPASSAPAARPGRCTAEVPCAVPESPGTGAAAVLGAVSRLTGAPALTVELPAGVAELDVPAGATVAQLRDAVLEARPRAVAGAEPRIAIDAEADAGAGAGAEFAVDLTRPGTLAVSVPVTGPGVEEALAVLAGRLARAVAAATADRPIGELPLLSEAERHLLTVRLNDTERPVPAVSALDLLLARAETDAGRVAVRCDAGELTYRELWHAAAGLADDLAALGVPRGGLVRVCLPRGRELVVAWLGIWLAGGVCVPLDPGYPAERLVRLTAETGDGPILVGPGSPTPGVPLDLARLLERPPADAPRPHFPIDPDAMAYVMFTSGSTGRPKAVGIPHRGLVNLLTVTGPEFGPRAGERSLQFASPSFDVSVWEIFAALSAGATVVPFDGEDVAADVLAGFVRRHEVSTVFLLAALLVHLDPARFPGVRTVVTGGDCSHQALADRWQPGRRLVYVYGPTEATVFQSWHFCAAGAADPFPTVGTPMPNLRYHVLDRTGAIAVPGAIGELVVAGAGVGIGYLNRDGTGAFGTEPVPPFGPAYRTGDLASHRADGRIDFRGRADHQVKVRGFRVELGEVEAALAAVCGDASAVVVAHRRADGETLLVGYLTGNAPGLGAVRAELARRLPYYMIPAALVPVAALPMTPHGKVDRALLAATPPPAAADGPADGPDDETGRAVLAAMAAVLDRPDLTPGADFFRAGGHSMAAAELAAALSAELGVRVRAGDVFTCPTPALLAARVRTLGAAGPAAAGPEPDLAGWLWRARQSQPAGSTAYSVPLLLHGTGTVEPGRLAAALRELERRHPVTTQAYVEARGELEIVPAARPAELEVVDLTAAPGELDGHVAARVATPFDLETGPLLRVTWFRLGPAAWALLLVADHLICDGPSLPLFAEDLLRGHDFPATAPDPDPGPGIAVDPQPERAAETYWAGRLVDPPLPLRLPTDVPRRPRDRRPAAAAAIELPPRTAAALDGPLRGRSPFSLAAAAVAVALARRCEAAEVCVGTAVDRRPALGRTGRAGCFVSTVPIRIPTAAGTVSDVLDATAASVIDAVDHAQFPFDRMTATLDPPRHPGRTPYFDVWVTLYDEVRAGAPPGLSAAGAPVPTAETIFDLSYQFCRHAGGCRMLLVYDRDLYHEETVAGLLGDARAALEELIDAPATAVHSKEHRAGQEPDREPLFAGFHFD